VVDGVVYLPAWDSKLYALGEEDGAVIWTATLPHLVDSSPSVGSDRIFVSDNFGWMHAVARADGKVLWSTQVDKHATAHLWSSPAYIADAGIVVVGVASGEEAAFEETYTFRGSVAALDAQTGMLKWQFYTTDNDQTSGPGIAVWGSPAVDTTRKVLYVGTGNNYAMPSGPYSDSMLAIDYTTGNLVWSHQFTMDDIFTVTGGAGGPDFDLGSSANLFSVDGTDYVGIGIKNGQYFAMDRDTGTVKWMTMLTQGSVLGGVISASAYADGVAFAASNRNMDGYTDTVAINVHDGKELWRNTAPMTTYGAVAHANGVLYLATTAGTVFALDGASGKVLWMADAPDSMAGGPAVADGKLFVPWGYQWTLGQDGQKGKGGLMVFGL
jgi:polyvinyl alcohol dehydrogenase (cytochrome)